MNTPLKVTMCVFVMATTRALASDGVSIDDLVGRAQIPLAAISPDGRFAAELLVRGDPVIDDYEATVSVIELRNGPMPIVLSKYRITPQSAFDETEGFQRGAGELRWVGNGELLYLTKAEGKAELRVWSASSKQSQVLLGGHDEIAFEPKAGSDATNSLISADFVDRPINTEISIADNAWRIRDGYQFYGAIRNPTTDHWVRWQRWTISGDTGHKVLPVGKPTEGWKTVPAERLPVSNTGNDDFDSVILDRTPSPDGTMTAAIEDADLNLRQPDESYSASRIIVLREGKSSVLVPFSRPARVQKILGWGPSGNSIYYLAVGAHDTTINRVSLDGQITVVHRDDGQLEVPGFSYSRRCQVITAGASSALLIRSTNVMPAELVEVNLSAGSISTIDRPNAVFSQKSLPEVRFYPIKIGDWDVYGRLYLPLNYRAGSRYPMVITQYYSRPGFYASTGDEVPILSLTANGFAVFAMHSHEFAQESHSGDFRLLVSRVKRPLEAMEWISDRLIKEGIVDRGRIGVTGLSYGAEIAMYAYWQSKLFRAVSTASASWDPSLVRFAGLGYVTRMEMVGFPMAHDESALRQWSELSAGMNARATLPPLLIQSGAAEENYTVPTWFQLRRAGAPVEWHEYPNEGHVKRSPAARWWTYSRNLDWFRFWLKDEQDPSPVKHEQYVRWQEMRNAWELAKKATSDSSLALTPR